MFFRKFGSLMYAQEGFHKEVTNILTAVLPRRLNVDETYIFQTYQIASGERPESVADKLYNDAQLYWTILVINDIINPYLDWAMSDEEVEAYTRKKYNGNVYGIHHYFWINSGKILDEVDENHWRSMPPEDLPELISPVTNIQFETEENTKRRDILVVNPRYISRFVESFNRALEGKEES